MKALWKETKPQALSGVNIPISLGGTKNANTLLINEGAAYVVTASGYRSGHKVSPT